MTGRIFDGVVHEGKLLLCDPDGFKAYFKSRFEGKAIQLTIEAQRRNRSDEANRYYRGVVVKIMAAECGYEPDEMHEALKARFLRAPEGEEINGLPRIRSTATLDTREFAEYVDRCIRLAAEMSIEIPEPCCLK